MNVGRTPSSAPDPPVRLLHVRATEADVGVGRRPGVSCVNTSATQSYQDICNLASRRASVARYAKLARRGANGLVRPLSTSISRT